MSFAALAANLEELFIRGLDRDEVAYQEFLHGLSGFLRSYLRRRFSCLRRPESDSGDVVQEVLLAVHSKRHLYDRNSSFAVWLHAIIRYRLMVFLRATNYAAHDIPLQEIEGFVGSEPAKTDMAIGLKKLLAALPERVRRPIELMKLQGLSVRETANLTRMSETAVRVNVHRGLKALTSALK